LFNISNTKLKMSKWEKFLDSNSISKKKEDRISKHTTKESILQKLESLPDFVRLILFVVFLGLSGLIFYMFEFVRSPQYHIMRLITGFLDD